jgi:hypothetical protein
LPLGFFGYAGSSGFGATIAAREFFHATGCINELLFTSEKRMTCRADTDFDILLGRTSAINSTARADNVSLIILWMDVRFHVWKGMANLGGSAVRASDEID